MRKCSFDINEKNTMQSRKNLKEVNYVEKCHQNLCIYEDDGGR
jgi:hypothetical protein